MKLKYAVTINILTICIYFLMSWLMRTNNKNALIILNKQVIVYILLNKIK